MGICCGKKGSFGVGKYIIIKVKIERIIFCGENFIINRKKVWSR